MYFYLGVVFALQNPSDTTARTNHLLSRHGSPALNAGVYTSCCCAGAVLLRFGGAPEITEEGNKDHCRGVTVGWFVEGLKACSLRHVPI